MSTCSISYLLMSLYFGFFPAIVFFSSPIVYSPS